MSKQEFQQRIENLRNNQIEIPELKNVVWNEKLDWMDLTAVWALQKKIPMNLKTDQYKQFRLKRGVKKKNKNKT